MLDNVDYANTVEALDALRMDKARPGLSRGPVPPNDPNITPAQPEQLLARLKGTAAKVVQKLKTSQESLRVALENPESSEDEIDTLSSSAMMLRKKLEYFRTVGEEISAGKYNDTSYYDELTGLFGKTPYQEISGDMSAALKARNKK